MLVDNFSRVSPAIKVDFSLNGKRVVEVLERLKLTVRLPKNIKHALFLLQFHLTA